MADFEKAFGPMIRHEGYPGYVNNPHDHGGETIAGISRKNWPGWIGWDMVDTFKKLPGRNEAMKNSADLAAMVKKFYRQNFWTPSLTEIESQDVANWLFDKYVNMGIRQANKLLQRALDLPDDGRFGPQTLRAVNSTDPAQVVAKCRDQAKTFYMALAEKDPTQKQFLKGWLARV